MSIPKEELEIDLVRRHVHEGDGLDRRTDTDDKDQAAEYILAKTFFPITRLAPHPVGLQA